MVEQGGDEDAGDDRQRLAEARGENEGEQLGLVADLCDGDRTGRNEESFHGVWSEASWSMVLPDGIARAMAGSGQVC